MSVPHLFLPPDRFSDDRVHITGADHEHLVRVLRAQPGDTLHLLDNRGNAYQAVIVSVERGETQAGIVGRFEPSGEPEVLITVAQSLGKSDKFDQVLQHGTEIGAATFVPIRADRSVVEIPSDRLADRMARWRQIAKSAAEQSHRARIPEIEPPVRLVDSLLRRAQHATCLLLHPDPERSIPLSAALLPLQAPLNMLIAVGPEGGWSSPEVEQALDCGATCVSISSRILRTETAALAAISQILYHFESSKL